MLIALSGLPGVGKSTIARELARQVDAVWLRIDSIEMAIFAAIPITGGTADLGYRVAHAVAEDNLRLGRTVVADAVNPWMLTRDAWRAVGVRSGARVVEIEIVCSDVAEHRRRFETRTNAPGLGAPDWEAVTNRDYRPWTRDRLVVDTAARSVAACVADIRRHLP